MTHPTAHDGYDYDIPESAMGAWEIGDDGIATFVPNGYPDATVGGAPLTWDEYQRIEDEAATQAFLRTYGMGSWMTLQPVRFPTTRVDAPVYA